MRPIRKLLLTLTVAAALLVPLAGAASADPIDGGGFSDPTIVTPVMTVQVSAPGVVSVKPTGASPATADPIDGGGY